MWQRVLSRLAMTQRPQATRSPRNSGGILWAGWTGSCTQRVRCCACISAAEHDVKFDASIFAGHVLCCGCDLPVIVVTGFLVKCLVATGRSGPA